MLMGAAVGYIGLSMFAGKSGSSPRMVKSYAAAYGPWGSADYGYPPQESEKWDAHDWGVTRNDEIEYMNNQIPAFSWDVYNPKAGIESHIPDDIMVVKHPREEKTSVNQKKKQYWNKMKNGGIVHHPPGSMSGYGASSVDQGDMGGGYGDSGGYKYSNMGMAVTPRVWTGRSRTSSALAKAYVGGQTAFARGNQPFAYPGEPSISPLLNPRGQVPYPDRVTSQMAKAYYGMREGASTGWKGEFPSDPTVNPYLMPKYFADMKYLGTKPVNNLDMRSPSTWDPSTPDFAAGMDY